MTSFCFAQKVIGFLLFFSLGISRTQELGVSPELMVSANETGSFVSFRVPREMGGATFEIKETNTPILDVFVSSAKLKGQQDGFPPFNASKITDSCLLLPFFKAKTIHIRTHFVDLDKENPIIHVSFWIHTPFGEAFHEKSQKLMKPFEPFYFYGRVHPSSLKEGKAIYPFFDSPQLTRNLSFTREDPPELTAVVWSIPRSGTHALVTTMESIFKEYIGSNDKEVSNSEIRRMSHHYGMAKATTSHLRMVYSHAEFQLKPFRKAVFVLRDPLECIDSYFHLIANGRHHSKKLPEETQYWKTETFGQYLRGKTYHITNKVAKMSAFRLPIYILRYQDMLLDERRSLREAISFIERIPVELTIWDERIKDHFEKKGLESISVADHRLMDNAREKKTKIHEKVLREHLEHVYYVCMQWIKDFDMARNYERVLNIQSQETAETKAFVYPVQKKIDEFFKSYLRFDGPLAPLFEKAYKEWEEPSGNFKLIEQEVMAKYKRFH